MVDFLDDSVLSAKWAGQIIDAAKFSADTITPDQDLQRALKAFQAHQVNAYRDARDFVLNDFGPMGSSSSAYVARLAQPILDVKTADQLDATMARDEVHAQFSSFKCNQKTVLSPALRELLCFGPTDLDRAPLDGRLSDLLGAALIGPQYTVVVNRGLTLAMIADFAQRSDNGSFTFVKAKVIERFSTEGPTPELQRAIQQRKSTDLLERLQLLTEANVLQQSITYGDYTAKLVEQVLYDRGKTSLNTDKEIIDASPLKQSALAAMRSNPVLARNVVLLAMRQAIAEGMLSRSKADAFNYEQTYYGLALHDLTGPQACEGSMLAGFARQKLGRLFPGWEFQYRVTAAQKKTDAQKQLEKCPTADADPSVDSPYPARGSGIALSVADFYVLVPSPPVLAAGIFEQSEGLHLALVYRDRVSQAIIDRNVAGTVRGLSGNGSDSARVAADTAFQLLNEGWGWQTRPKSK